MARASDGLVREFVGHRSRPSGSIAKARLGLACIAVALTAAADLGRADDRPSGIAPIWEDPAGFEPVALAGLATSPANTGWVVSEDDSVCGPLGTVGSVNVGQTFIPRTDRIWRMDFAASNATNAHIDSRPGIVRIFKWHPKGYFATVATKPLFEQTVDLAGYPKNQIRIYPDLRFSPEERDDTYFVEFSIPGKDLRPQRAARHGYVMDAVRASVDPYPDGSMYRSCTLWDGRRSEAEPGRGAGDWWDLWFEFHGVKASPPGVRPLVPSDPAARWYPPLAAPTGDLRHRYWRRVNEFAAWNRPAALAPTSNGAHVHLFNETVLYLACKNRGECPAGLDPQALLDGIQQMFRRAVVERAACRDPQYGSCYIDFIELFSPGLAVQLLRDAGALDSFPPALKAGIRDLIFERTLERSFAKREYGTNAWALSGMATYAMFHALFPAETPKAWIDYYQTVWKSFWDARDTESDSEGYQELSLYYILAFARFAPITPDASRWYTDIWSDPHFRKLIDRFEQTVTPIGSYPNYGDGSGVSLGVPALIWLFEEAATRYGDARYRETARRLLDYNERYARSRAPSAGGFWDSLQVGGPTFQGLALAYLAAGSTPVPDQPSSPGSVYTLRRRATRQGDPLPPAPAFTFSASATPTADIPASLIATAPGVQTAHYVPDKLILRSGGGPDGLSFVFNLLSGYHHGHPETGALASFTDDGAILMMDVPFASYLYRHRPEDESAPVMRHFRGGLASFEKRGNDVEMLRFTDAAAATVVWTAFGDVDGWQVRQRRHFLFAKDRFLLVRDGFEAGPTQPRGIEVAIGPVWHAADVSPERDTNPDAKDWYDLYHQQPVGNTTRFRNPERYSLLYFVGRAGTTTAAYKEGAYLTLADSSRSPGSLELNPVCKEPSDPLTQLNAGTPECRTTPPFILYQTWSGTLQTGQARWFDSLLLPHARSSAAAVAANVHELAVGDDYTALQVDVGDERWIVVDNPNRRNVSATRLANDLATSEPYLTNAEYLMLRFKPGSPAYIVVSQADFIHTGSYRQAFSPAKTGEFESEPASRL